MIDTRQELHQLIDLLPQETIDDARQAILDTIARADPLLYALLTAPIDDEPETPEEAAAIAKAWEDIRAGRVVRLDDIRDELLKE